ncbi:PA26 p53-induced protein-domain-containing protein [Gilbertella persicaria]|uniref:PA26 p53-induced protein-domain-containing protein n=1 Tax=Gilbertella persicaria TaxID=101096 RepID=UPI00221FB0AF|nr:PA26 p53-induced protein-domain-containing protein [Gilbertella persicaria]KAI8091427.1 PA26 p53-induced protein-domain-containing protein [Gilbertella persicaria]
MSQPWNQLDDQQAEIIRDSRAGQLQSCRQRIALFKGLQVDSYEDRAAALEKIIQVIKSYVRSSLSPSSSAASPNLSDSIQELEESRQDEDFGAQLFYYLLTILRLSLTCPYSDVRQTCRDLLTGLKESAAICIPKQKYKSPSHFIPISDIFSLESTSSCHQTVLYPRSSNLSFSPWSYTNSSVDEPISHQQIRQPTSAASSIHNVSLNATSSVDYTGGRPSDEYVRQMLIKTFTDEGRLANLYRVLAFFPTFFEIFHVTFTKTLKAPLGPLNRTWKTYLALMVASEQKCQYLVSIMKLDFLYNGGDPNWLLGLDFVPTKLRNISTLVLKLARQPWRLTSEDISHLLAGGVLGDAWSRGELVQATLIIATFLGLSSFVLGCGITPEVDMTGGFVVQQPDLTGIENELDLPTIHLAGATDEEQHRFNTDHGVGLGVTTTSADTDDQAMETTQELIHKLKSKKNCAIKDQILESLDKMKIQEPTKMTVNTNFDNKDETNHGDHEECDDGSLKVNFVHEDLQRFVNTSLDEVIQLEEFEQEHEEYAEFMLGEYCWEDHGCDLANHYLPGIGDDLVAEFTEAISITDWSIFHPVAEEVVDTSPLRYAIWYYTQKIMGVTKEDYTYSDIPTYLNDRTTKYIHDLCMSPHKIQKNDWCNIGISLRPEEKCHVNLLVASARKQAILCYGLCLISEV